MTSKIDRAMDRMDKAREIQDASKPIGARVLKSWNVDMEVDPPLTSRILSMSLDLNKDDLEDACQVLVETALEGTNDATTMLRVNIMALEVETAMLELTTFDRDPGSSPGPEFQSSFAPEEWVEARSSEIEAVGRKLEDILIEYTQMALAPSI